MNDRIVKELIFDHPREAVWEAIATSEALAEWMYRNDFEPKVGHRFSFRVPAKPEVGFDGLTVACEVVVCEPPAALAFTWVAGGIDTMVCYRLEADASAGAAAGRTRMFFEHAGFAPDQKAARGGAEYGWGAMHGRLATLVARAG